MPLCTEVGIDPGHIALDAEQPLHPQRGTAPPIFGPCLSWPNSWMDRDALGRDVDIGPGDIVLDGDPAFLKGAQPPHFV